MAHSPSVAHGRPQREPPHWSRRELLSVGWLAAMGGLGLSATRVVGALLLPPPVTNANRQPNRDPLDLGLAGNLPGPEHEPWSVPPDRLRLVALPDGLVAFSSLCPSRGCLYSWKPDRGLFICPCCGSRFDRMGRLLDGPARRNLDYYTIEAFDARGRRVARTPEGGGPVGLPPEARVVVYPGEAMPGAPIEGRESPSWRRCVGADCWTD